MDNYSNGTHKPLTTGEIRAQAENWTLAGDVGLLAHLEQFSQNILERTRESQAQLDNLVAELDTTTTTINNVTNKFLALQNSQFVENRVYDDETPIEEKKEEPNVPDKGEEERLLLSKYKEAVGLGLQLLDTHFDQVELLASSDSDDEDSPAGTSSLVWRPRNPYASKPFPLMIGSAEWWADDSVGLGDYDENMESEKVVSDTDSDMETNTNNEKRVRLSPSSESESEVQLSPKKSRPNHRLFLPEQQGPLGGEHSPMFDSDSENLFGDPKGLFDADENMFGGRSENVGERNEGKGGEEHHDQLQQTNTATLPDVEPGNSKLRHDLTKEISARLGSVISQQREASKSNNAAASRKPNSNLFGEDDNNDDNDNDGSRDLFSSSYDDKTSTSNKARLKNDLFGDDFLESGKKEKTSSSKSKSDLFGDDFLESGKKEKTSSSKSKSDLFGDDFLESGNNKQKTSSSKTKSDLFGDDLLESGKKEKTSFSKPKSDLFGDDFLDSSKKEKISSSKLKNDLFGDDFLESGKKEKTSSSKSKSDLFGDDFLESGNKEKISSGDLFGGDIMSSPSSDDLFGGPSAKSKALGATSQGSTSQKSANQSRSLLDDLFAAVDEDTLFTVKPRDPRISHIRESTESKPSPGLRFSTPTEDNLSGLRGHLFPPEEDLFGGVSDIASEAPSANYSDGPLNSGRLGEESQDLGIGGSTGTDSKSLTEEFFHPPLTSTRRAASGERESGYNTQKTSTKSPSMQEGNSSAGSLMGHSEQAHFPRDGAAHQASRAIFGDDEDDRDLFGPSLSKSTPGLATSNSKSLFEDVADDLFAAVPTVHLGPSDGLFIDSARQPDTVSVSSSRSSIFDDVSIGKSTLPSIFDKNSKTKSDADDLFGDAGTRRLSGQDVTKHTSLFGDLDDGEDLFSSSKVTSLGEDELFGAKPHGSVKNTDGATSGSSKYEKADAKGEVSQQQSRGSWDLSDQPSKSQSNGSGDMSGQPPKSQSKGIKGSGDVPDQSSKPQPREGGDVPDLPSKPLPTENEDVPDQPSKHQSSSSAPKSYHILDDGSDKLLFGGASEPDDDLFSNSSKTSLLDKKATPHPKNIKNIVNKHPVERSSDLPPIVTQDLFSAQPTVTDDLFGASKAQPTVTDDLFGASKAQPTVTDDLFGASKAQPTITDDLFSRSSKAQPTITDDLFSRSSKAQPTITDDLFSRSSKAQPTITDDLFSRSSTAQPTVTEDVLSRHNKAKSENLLNTTPLPGSAGLDSSADSETVSRNKVHRLTKHLFQDEGSKVLPESVVAESSQDIGPIKALVSKKPDPPKSLSITKNSDLLKNAEEVDGGAVSSIKSKKVGRLNMPAGLNINVSSLLPGAKPTKLNSTVPASSSSPSAASPVVAAAASAAVNVAESPRSTPPHVAPPADESSGLLRCSSRDRAKIQVRRRPQSRRARQEALRTSGIDFGDPQADDECNGVAPSAKASLTAEDLSLFHSVENSPDTLFSSPLSPSTDEEDYFSVPELDVTFEKEDQGIFRNMMNPVGVRDNVLFDSVPVLNSDLFSVQTKSTSQVAGGGLTFSKASIPNETNDLFSDKSSTSHKTDSLVDEYSMPNALSCETPATSQTPNDRLSISKPSGEKVHSPLFEEINSTTGQQDSLAGKSSTSQMSVSTVACQPTLQANKGLFDDDPVDMFLGGAMSNTKLGKRNEKMSKLFGDSEEEGATDRNLFGQKIGSKSADSEDVSGADGDLFGQKIGSKPAGSKFTTPRVSKHGQKTVSDKSIEQFVDPLGLVGSHTGN